MGRVGGGEAAGPLIGVQVRVNWWVGPEWWLGWSAYPLVVLCAGIMCSTLLLLPVPQKWQLGFGLFVSCS